MTPGTGTDGLLTTPAPHRSPATRGRAWRAWSGGLALLIAAWGITLASTTFVRPFAPFATVAMQGEEAVGRSFSATIHDVRATTHVTGSVPLQNMEWYADGNWVIVDLTITGRDTIYELLGGANLVVGDRTYRASERPASLLSTPLQAGVPRTGSLAFDLPSGLLSDTIDAELQLYVNAEMGAQADSMIVFPLDLSTLDVSEEEALVEPEWVSPR